MQNKQSGKLTPQQLRRRFDLGSLGLDSIEKLEPLEGIIGQKRAVAALQFGLGIEKKGFNTYVAGPPGIGKMTAVQGFIEELAAAREVPADHCYVNNFDDSYCPTALALAAGHGRQFQKEIDNLIGHFQAEIPKAFEGEDYNAKRERIIKAFEHKRAELQEEIGKKASQANFNIEATPQGVAIVPMLSGRALSEAEVAELPEEARKDLQKRRDSLEQALKSMLKKIRQMQRETQAKLQRLDEQVTLYVVGDQIDDLIEKYAENEKAVAYLEAVKNDVQHNIAAFRSQEAPSQVPALAALTGSALGSGEAQFRKYQVNVVVDNGKLEGAPVVIEYNPSYNNLFGRIEKEVQLGALYTDFLMIKAGAMHRANGGYLVLPVEALMRYPLSWQGLKRAIQSEQIAIEEPGEFIGAQAVKSQRPEPIRLNVKIVLVGSPAAYYLLHAHDEEFAELFKVKADFDTRMDSSDENVHRFIRIVCTLCTKEKLLHLDGSGAARVLEYSLRLAGDQEKISTQFGAVADVVREASYWAVQDSAEKITREHVNKAVEEKVYRSSLLKERIQEMISRGTLIIDTETAATGQVNGLSVIKLGDYPFGRPNRITASVGPGRSGIIDIEREINLGGPIHSKGVLIISGFLTGRFAQHYPLTLSSRLVFEQSYEGIDGDSASSTELYALLSSLAGVPIKQGIAVTGSVDQTGQVQPIGGVNEKIEGFFEVCRTQALTGEQGVLIPVANIKNLMLRDEIVEAVSAGQFHIWAVANIDQGIEILTGKAAGVRSKDGTFPVGSINHLVDRRLREFAECVREFTRPESE